MEENKTVKTSLGLEQNVEALLCYVLGFITGIVFLLIEKDNKFVRFHAMQSTATFVSLFVIQVVIGIIPVLGWAVAMLISLLSLILWIVLMIKAFQGEMFKLPVVGDFAEKQINK